MPELFYATNASGHWVSQLVSSELSREMIIPPRLALAIDATGSAHAAIVAVIHPGEKKAGVDERALLVGHNAAGRWKLTGVDSDAVGAVAIGVEATKGTPPVYVAYFGEKTFKVAQVQIYP